jgi:hypothetical protein
MKKYTVYLYLAALLLSFGVLAILGSFAVYFLPGLIANPVQTLYQSFVLFGAGTVALYGQRRAIEAANARRMAYQYARRF